MFAVQNENRLLGVRQMVHRLETRIVTARARKCFGAVFLYENFKIKIKCKTGAARFFGTGGDEKHVFLWPKATIHTSNKKICPVF